MENKYTVGKPVSFHYNGRQVKGMIERVEAKHIVVRLTIDYYGKNEGWDAGELKVCYTAKIK